MTKQKEVPSSGYEATPAEMQNVILNWVKATEEFHRRYSQLTEVINTLQASTRRQPVASRARLRNLMTLRQRMSDVLMTLLLDMTGQKQGRSAQPSKPGQLQSHTRLLEELNNKIDAELSKLTVAQA